MRTHMTVGTTQVLIPRVKEGHPLLGEYVVRVSVKNLSKYRALRSAKRYNEMVVARGEGPDTYAAMVFPEGYCVARKLDVHDQLESMDGELVAILNSERG